MPKHKPRGPRPSRVRWFVRGGCVRVYGNAAAKREVREAMAATEAAPKSLEGSWDTTEAGEHDMGSGRKRGRDILAGNTVDAYQVAGFFRRKAKVQKQEEKKGKQLERSPQLQSWKWWGGDPMWWLAEEAIRKAEKKHGKKFGRCDREKNGPAMIHPNFYDCVMDRIAVHGDMTDMDLHDALIELREDPNDTAYEHCRDALSDYDMLDAATQCSWRKQALAALPSEPQKSRPQSKRKSKMRRLNAADPNEIRWAIDAELEDLANQSTAESQSYRFDYEEETDKAEEDGYDPSTLIKVASYGDSVAVDGDLLVPPHIMKLLNLKPRHHRVMLWTEMGKGMNEDAWTVYYDYLRGMGYDRLARIGGADPTGSPQELAVDTVVQAVLNAWDVSSQGDKPTAAEVQSTLAQYGIGSGDVVYWESSSGDIEWFAKLPAKEPASKRRSRMRALNAVGDRIMIISRGEYPSGYPGGAKAAWVDEGTVMDEITARDTGGVIQIKARMDDDDSVYTFRRDYGVGRAKGGGTIFDPAILMPYAWIVTEIDGQPAGATDYYEIRYLGKAERKSPKTRREKMRGLNALKRRLTRV